VKLRALFVGLILVSTAIAACSQVDQSFAPQAENSTQGAPTPTNDIEPSNASTAATELPLSPENLEPTIDSETGLVVDSSAAVETLSDPKTIDQSAELDQPQNWIGTQREQFGEAPGLIGAPLQVAMAVAAERSLALDWTTDEQREIMNPECRIVRQVPSAGTVLSEPFIRVHIECVRAQ
jgi:hypothetical protein